MSRSGCVAAAAGGFLVSVLAAAAPTSAPAPRAGGPAKAAQAAGDAGDKEGKLEIGDDVKDVPAQDLRALGDEYKRYFLIGPHDPKEEAPPKEGYALLLVMPGGPGDVSQTSFVRRIWKNACPKDWIVAELVSVKWDDNAGVVWPTRFSHVNNMRFTTEEFADAVIKDVKTKQKIRIDPARTYQLGWSSGGPAEYAIALQENPPVTASFIAMSVFMEKVFHNDVKHAQKYAFYLFHSPADETCKFELAQKAVDSLERVGADVDLVTYPGGHGWPNDVYDRLQKGFHWMEKKHGKPARKE